MESKSTVNNWEETWSNGLYTREREAGIRACFDRGRYLNETISVLGYKPHKLLDLGCGDAETSKYILLSNPSVEAIFVDWSKEAIHRAEINLAATSNNKEFVLADSRSISKEYFRDVNILLSLGVIEHSINPSYVVQDISSNLEDGTLVVFMTPNRLSTIWLSRKILELTKKWTIGFQREYSTSQLEGFCENTGELVVLHKEAIPRKYISEDSKLTKILAFIDRLINLFYRDWGWYAFVFAKKTPE